MSLEDNFFLLCLGKSSLVPMGVAKMRIPTIAVVK